MESDRAFNQRPFLLRVESAQVWVQTVGRLLYQTGYGAIQFFIPLVFVNQVGLSATAVGFAIGCGALAGMAGHFLGGYLADSPDYGRKRALIFSAILSLLAAGLLIVTKALPLLIFVNLIMGISAGCYWTAADASVVDVTPSDQRQRAFGVLVLADSIGLGLGIWGGRQLLTQPQPLFFAGSVILLLFLIFIGLAVAETQAADSTDAETDTLKGFAIALKDQSLRLFILANVLFTTYIGLISSTLPLYFTRHMGTSEADISNQFTLWYIGFGALIQLPLVQALSRLRQVSVLMISMGLWIAGFVLVWAVGPVTTGPVGTAIALAVLSLAGAAYKPFAPALVAELAPESFRGIYLAISYQCWSLGYFIGPVLGGWALDQPGAIAQRFWLGTAVTTLAGIGILYQLGQSEDRAAEEQLGLTPQLEPQQD